MILPWELQREIALAGNLKRRDVPVSEVSSVLQAGHSHRIRPRLDDNMFAPLGCALYTSTGRG